jgi:ribosomal protein S18 acetylase RimI-like enzyme
MIPVNWTTRQATPEDKEYLYSLNRAAYEDVVRRQFGEWDEAWQRQYFEKKWEPQKYEIVEQEGRRIGVLSVLRTDEEVRIVEIQLLPECQGRGIGSELLQREFRYADARAMPVRLQVLRENRAKTLYERLGFEVYGETDTHLLMERTKE